jgi:hypothetical protein
MMFFHFSLFSVQPLEGSSVVGGSAGRYIASDSSSRSGTGSGGGGGGGGTNQLDSSSSSSSLSLAALQSKAAEGCKFGTRDVLQVAAAASKAATAALAAGTVGGGSGAGSGTSGGGGISVAEWSSLVTLSHVEVSE